jgi:hypothetical protein
MGDPGKLVEQRRQHDVADHEDHGERTQLHDRDGDPTWYAATLEHVCRP